MSKIDSAPFARRLLAWYDRDRRELPWRAAPGMPPDPYHVWLSEIMLQQTTVAAVGAYFRAFVARWPTVAALADADLDEVLHAWQGLGYYARARNLHRCAKLVAGELDGRFPETEAGLARLPGIGPYTAAAVAAIAFERPAVPVDANIARVLARLFAVETPLHRAKPRLKDLAGQLAPKRRPGDFAQAMMDLGAMVCTPQAPNCARCPLAPRCAAHARGIAERLPVRAPKRAKPTRYGIAFWAVRDDGAVLLRRRAERGLLGGMIEVPSTPWVERPWRARDALAHAPLSVDAWRALPGVVRHGFTHFRLELRVMTGRVAGVAPDGLWSLTGELGRHALPTLMKKVCAHAIDHLGPAVLNGDRI